MPSAISNPLPSFGGMSANGAFLILPNIRRGGLTAALPRPSG